MKIKEIALIVFLAILVGITVGGTIFVCVEFIPIPAVDSNQNLGGSIDVPGYTAVGPTAGTSTIAVASSTASTQMLATSTARTYAILVPQGNIYCNLDGGKPAVFGSGIFVASGTALVLNLNEDSLYRGTVNCISASGLASTSVYSH